jgi:hypothetical protein
MSVIRHPKPEPGPDPNIAIQNWMRTQLAPIMDRSLCAALGVRKLKKRPFGSPPRFVKRFALHLPAPKRKRQDGRIVITVPEPRKRRASNRPIMRHWRIEVLPQSTEARPPAWMLEGPRVPATFCPPYQVTLGSMGFTMRDGHPVSTYVPYRRIAAGGQTSKHIADRNDNEYQQKLAAEPGEGPVPVGPIIVLSISTVEVEAMSQDFPQDQGNSDIRRDTETRYVWQAPRVLAVDRRRTWKFWREARRPVSISKAKPWEREGISRRSWYRRRGTTSS